MQDKVGKLPDEWHVTHVTEISDLGYCVFVEGELVFMFDFDVAKRESSFRVYPGDPRKPDTTTAIHLFMTQPPMGVDVTPVMVRLMDEALERFAQEHAPLVSDQVKALFAVRGAVADYAYRKKMQAGLASLTPEPSKPRIIQA